MALFVLALLTACEALGVEGPTVCEDWVKTQIVNPESYLWSKSNWSSSGPDVSIEFTSKVDGESVSQTADCIFVDPEAEQLEVDVDKSTITKWNF